MTQAQRLAQFRARLDAQQAPATTAAAAAVDTTPRPDEALPEYAVLVIAHEGEVTSDGRLVEPDALTWRQPPISFTRNHDPAELVGLINPVARVASLSGLSVENFADKTGTSGPFVVGLVQFDLGYDGQGNLANPDALGREAARQVDGGFLSGVSMEVGNQEIEWRCIEEDADGFCVDELMVLLKAQIGTVTLAPFQAIESAEVVDVAEPLAASAALRWWPCPTDANAAPAPLVAGAVQMDDYPTDGVYPADAFADPGFTEYTPFTVAGWRVFGHLAPHNVCHVGIQQACRTAPLSNTDYAYFHQIAVDTTEGVLDVGLLVTDRLHVDLAHEDGTPVTADEARRRAFENPGARACYLRAGEDEHGIWVAGVLTPNVSEAQLDRINHTPVSGDWRPIRMADGTFVGTELISANCVNVAGFPGVRARALAAAATPDGEPELLALVAALGPHQHGCGCGGTNAELELALAEVEARQDRTDAIIAALGLDEQAVEALTAAIHPG